MTINLDSAIENSLILQISEGLRQVHVEDNCFVFMRTFEWCRELHKLFSEEQIDRLHDFCGEDGLRQFVHSEVASAIRFNYDFEKDAARKPLTSFAEFSNPVSAARQIVKRLKQLPYAYRVSLQLPAGLSANLWDVLDTYKLSDSISLHSKRHLPQPFPLKNDNPLKDERLFDRLIGKDDFQLNDDRIFISIRASGHVGLYTTPLIPYASDILKAFYGAALAVGLAIDGTSPEKHEAGVFIIHQMNKDDSEIIYTEDVDSDLDSSSCRLKSLSLEGEQLSDRQKRVIDSLDAVSSVFGTDKHARKMFTSCVWLYRSYVSFNPLDSLLESTIAIEALLGDKENQGKLGISRLLGNRCAYLLGRSMREREDIIRQFDDIISASI